jgi:hypothetical protein
MTKELDTLITDKYLNCFGDFNMTDDICKKHCILSLRCIVEKNQNARMEIFEEMMASDAMPVRLQ